MANRRMGGMGGPPNPHHQRGVGGNRSFSHHQPFQGNVSPWQGGNNMPMSAPPPPPNSQSLLGQLAANPQQLALALSNLLQPQHHHQPNINNAPPSLLSLNTSSPAFSHDRNDSFNNRFSRIGRSDFRRNEPYNKNRGSGGGWRQIDSNRNAAGNRGNRSSGNQRNDRGNDTRRRSSPTRSSSKSTPSKSATTPAKGDASKEDTKKTATKDDVNAEPGSDEAPLEQEDTDDKDADVKPEKKSDESKESTAVKDEQEEAEEGATKPAKKDKESSSRSIDGKYHGVPQKFLHCFVCNKDMWDGESFQKHVRGRAHKQMLDSLEESFHITVNILRENLRLTEEKKTIELNRMQRLSKNKYNRKFQEQESHCNMCDLKFLGKIINHRKTEGHQRLKRFLHPSCDICSKEFPSRMDWVDHRLLPEHLRRLNEILVSKVGGTDGEIIEDDLETDLEPLLEESIELEEENPIVELSDDMTNFVNRLPAYKKTRPVGTDNLKPFTGSMCDLCHRSFETEQLAQAHLTSKAHYYAFIDAAKLQYKKQSEEAARKEREKKRQKEREEAKAKVDSDKKGKVDKSQEEEEDEEKMETSQNGDGDQEMYDPEEACNQEEESVQEDQSNDVTAEEPEEEEEAESVQDAEKAPPEEAEKPQQQPQQQKQEPEPKQKAAPPAPEQPKQQQATPAAQTPGRVTRRVVGGAVKNGAGPRSKKLSPQETKTESKPATGATAAPSSATTLSTFRIPKVGEGAVKNGAGPKCKKQRVE